MTVVVQWVLRKLNQYTCKVRCRLFKSLLQKTLDTEFQHQTVNHD